MLDPQFDLRFAEGADDLADAQRLRYSVFIDELGGQGPDVDHAQQREADDFDSVCRHLILRDLSRPRSDRVIGVYRLLDEEGAAQLGRFYSEGEYDLAPLYRSRRKLLELGRSCLHREYRGGPAMYHLWSGLAEHIERAGVEVLFGVASFHGTDVHALAAPLSILHHRHLAPDDLRVTAKAPGAVRMDQLAEDAYDRREAMRAVPSLIKAYLRLGGTVGDGAWIDTAFNTTDVCMVMDTRNLSARSRAIYTRPRG